MLQAANIGLFNKISPLKLTIVSVKIDYFIYTN